MFSEHIFMEIGPKFWIHSGICVIYNIHLYTTHFMCVASQSDVCVLMFCVSSICITHLLMCVLSEWRVCWCFVYHLFVCFEYRLFVYLYTNHLSTHHSEINEHTSLWRYTHQLTWTSIDIVYLYHTSIHVSSEWRYK